MKTFLHNITYAPLKFLKEIGAALGILLGSYQGITIFFPNLLKDLVDWKVFLSIIFISIIYGLSRIWKPSKISFNIPHTNTTIEIFFGNLFKQDGWKVVPVNDFFDSKIGKPVSNKTLHGILIEEHLKGNSFDNIVDNQLTNIPSEIITKKNDERQRRYPIGTTVTMETDGKYLLFALSKTDPETYKAHCDVAIMWLALEGLLKLAKIESNGDPINFPLIGNGQSSVGLSENDLLNLLILSIITETKKQQRIADKIRIVLKKDLFEKLDLRDVKQRWEK